MDEEVMEDRKLIELFRNNENCDKIKDNEKKKWK